MKFSKHLFMFLIILCFFCSNGTAHASDQLETVTLQLKWFHQFQFAGYYAAKDKGFYTGEGLNVILKERYSDKSHIQAVINGEAEYGVADASLLLDRMKRQPVVLLKQIFQHSPSVFFP